MNAIEPSRLLQLRSAILAENSALQKAAGRGPAAEVAPSIDGLGKTFGETLRSVNEQQSRSSAITEAYERGQTSDIVAVMVERQKASIGFEATLQVRNKLLSAYRDIMNMPV